MAVCRRRFAVAAGCDVVLVLAFPPFVFGVPRLVAFLDCCQRLFGF